MAPAPYVRFDPWQRMLNRYLRDGLYRLLTPIANGLIRLGVSPDVVTVVGTLCVCFGALAFYPRH